MMRNFEIGRFVHLKAEIRNRRLNGRRVSQRPSLPQSTKYRRYRPSLNRRWPFNIRFRISGFEMKESSDFKFSLLVSNRNDHPSNDDEGSAQKERLARGGTKNEVGNQLGRDKKEDNIYAQ